MTNDRPPQFVYVRDRRNNSYKLGAVVRNPANLAAIARFLGVYGVTKGRIDFDLADLAAINKTPLRFRVAVLPHYRGNEFVGPIARKYHVTGPIGLELAVA